MYGNNQRCDTAEPGQRAAAPAGRKVARFQALSTWQTRDLACELRRAQGELDMAQARYFDLYDLAPLGYCTLSGKGEILEANFTAATLLGVPRGALVKHSILQFILPEYRDLYGRYRKQVLEGHSTDSGEAGQLPSCELRMVTKEGDFFWARLESMGTKDEGGEPVWRLALSDLSGRQQVPAQRFPPPKRKRRSPMVGVWSFLRRWAL